MSTEPVHNYRSTCAELDRVLQDLDVNIRVSEQNIKLRETYTEQLRHHENNLRLCNMVIENVKPLVDETLEYVNRRREESMQSINQAIRLACSIIPDADPGTHFELDGDEAWLATSDELSIQNTEGGAFREISSTFIRSVVASTNPNILQTLMLDEMFAHVSVANTETLSQYLNVIGQDMQIICIEQKPEIKSNIDTTIYTFRKGDQYTEVTSQVLHAGETYVVQGDKQDESKAD